MSSINLDLNDHSRQGDSAVGTLPLQRILHFQSAICFDTSGRSLPGPDTQLPARQRFREEFAPESGADVGVLEHQTNGV
jgi:hypothetical protein